MHEGRAAFKIRSEHVVRMLDVCESDGVPYLVTEYLDGLDLAALLEREGKLAPAVAVDYLLQACEALAEAHAQRIIHRDLKPANLFLVHGADGTPIVKVLDFGISKVMVGEGSESLSMTTTTVTMGSPLYMSPEQLKSSKGVDERTDIWALGVILFELLTGRRPFVAHSMAELGALVLAGTAPDVRDFAPDTPPALAAAVATCLRCDSAQRFPSVAELSYALAPFGSESAQASAQTIRRLLETVPRPASSWGAYGTPSKARLALAETAVDATSVWGEATDFSSTGGPSQAAAPPPPPRAMRRPLAFAVVALLIGVGVLAGITRPWAPHVTAARPPASAVAAIPVATSAPTAPIASDLPTAAAEPPRAPAGASVARKPAARAGAARPVLATPPRTSPSASAGPPAKPTPASDFSPDRFE